MKKKTIVIAAKTGTPVTPLTPEAWAALTPEEKIAAGLVTIGTTENGIYYNYSGLTPAEVELKEYIPASDLDTLVSIAKLDNFDDTAITWGTGDTPLTMTAPATLNTAQTAVVIDTTANDFRAMYERAAADDFTIYIVSKFVSGQTYARLISAVAAAAAGNGPVSYTSGAGSVNVGYYGADVTKYITTTADQVYAISRNETTGETLYADSADNTYSANVATAANADISIAADPVTSTGDLGTYEVKCIILLDAAESLDVMKANIAALKTKFNIS